MTITLVSVSRPNMGVEYLGPPFQNWDDGVALAIECIKGHHFEEHPTGNGVDTPGDRSRQWKDGSTYLTVEEVEVSDHRIDGGFSRWLLA
jgi:hypothetical protein